MIGESHVVNLKQPARRDILITASLAFYIYSFYQGAITPLTQMIGSLALYAFVGLTFVKLILSQTLIKITSYTIWFIVFCLLGLGSFFYALDGDATFSALYTLFVSLILTFAFIQYVHEYSSIKRIFSFFAYFPIYLVLYLFISGKINTSGERLGESFFRNSNDLALVMMIALFCITWLIIYAGRKFLWINIIIGFVYLYVIALTGGRKFLLVPFIFLFFLFILLSYQKKQSKYLFYLMLLTIIALATIWAVINIPALYQLIGVRFEGLLSFFQEGTANTDASTLTRYLMIAQGWDWFLEKPVLGFGLNNYVNLSSSAWGTLNAAYAHNNYIELMVDLGAVGIFLYYSFYVYMILRLFKMHDDGTGLRNFFLAFMPVLLIFEIGAVTYNLYPIQIFLCLAAAYTRLHDREMMGLRNDQIINSIRL